MAHGFAFPGWIAAGFCAFIIGGTFAQYFHGTLHRADNPAIIPVMRRLGLLMTPEAHQLHHDSLRRDFSTRSEEHTSELQSLMRISYAVFCLQKKNFTQTITREYT